MGGQATACTECNGPGQYSDESLSSACKTAPAGHKPTSDRTTVEPCAAGTYSVGGASECTECEARKFSAQGAVGCTAATTCVAGTRTKNASTRTSDTVCEDCAAGAYSTGGTAECTKCESGKYSTATKAVGCTLATTCGVGTRIKTASTSTSNTFCEDCTAGKYSTGDTTECTECQEGFYSSSFGAPTCFACEAGKYTNAEQTECLKCPAGKTSGVAAPLCTACDRGKYAEGKGNLECSFCDDDDVLRGSTTAANGTTSSLGCVCPKGKYEDPETAVCATVPEGVREDVEGMNVSTTNLRVGYWRTSTTSKEVRNREL